MDARRAALACCLTLLAGTTILVGSAAPATAPASRPSTVPATQPYVWRQVNDAAGGDCAGIYFHPQDASIRYVASARGGGGYLWDFPGQRWVGFTVQPLDADGGVAPNTLLGVAVDPTDRNVVYVAEGVAGAGGGRAEVYRSVDRGKTFAASGLRLPGVGRVAGDLGRPVGLATGERLVADPNNPAVLYFASPRDGLFRTARASAPASWEPVPLPPAARDPVRTPAERTADQEAPRPPPVRLTAVAIDPGGGTVDAGGVRRSRVVYVGVTTLARRERPRLAETRPATATTSRSTTGPTVVAAPPADPGPAAVPASPAGIWRTTDGGETWARLGGRPVVAAAAPSRLVVRRDGTLWATVAGRVVKAPREAAAVIDVTPPASAPNDEYHALAVDAADPRHVVVARFGAPWPNDKPVYGDENRLFRTTDGGQTWRPLAAAAGVPPWAEIGVDAYGFATRTEVLRFEPNAPKDAAGRSRTLWLGDALGPWVCQDLDADVTNWKLVNRGRGGALVSAVACPPGMAGATVAPLLAGGRRREGGPAVGGFRYVNLSAVPERPLTFNERKDVHGLGEVTSLDVCESDPRVVVAVGGWESEDVNDPPYTGGGVSTDNGVTWTPFGEKGEGLNGAGLPNLWGTGDVAIGSTRPAGKFPDIVWTPGDRAPRHSTDGGRTWAYATGTFGERAYETSSFQRTLAADPVEGRTFYRLAIDPSDWRMSLFASADGGATWERRGVVPLDERRWLPRTAVLRARPGRAGDLWLSLDEPGGVNPARPIGLYRSTDGGRTWARLGPWRRTFGFAFGAPAPGRPNPSLVLAAELPDGRFGIFLSDDATALPPAETDRATWRQVWEPSTTDVPAVVACLRTIGADRQSYGRIYAGAPRDRRGLYYGEPVPQGPPAAPTNVTARPVAGGVEVEWSDPVGAAEYDVQRQAVEAGAAGTVPATTASTPLTAPATAPATIQSTGTAPAATRPAEWRTVVTATWQARFLDTTAEPGTRYLYRVIASNAFGRSDPSAASAADPRK